MLLNKRAIWRRPRNFFQGNYKLQSTSNFHVNTQNREQTLPFAYDLLLCVNASRNGN